MTACCPDHDPLIRAGFLSCPRCGRIAYPTDAAWLDDRRVLVVYAPVCEHRGRCEVWTVDVDQVQPVKIPDPRQASRRRCTGTTRAGAPCRGWASAGSDYCSQHGPARRDGDR